MILVFYKNNEFQIIKHKELIYKLNNPDIKKTIKTFYHV